MLFVVFHVIMYSRVIISHGTLYFFVPQGFQHEDNLKYYKLFATAVTASVSSIIAMNIFSDFTNQYRSLLKLQKTIHLKNSCDSIKQHHRYLFTVSPLALQQRSLLKLGPHNTASVPQLARASLRMRKEISGAAQRNICNNGIIMFLLEISNT